jgi:hypothetical protein
MLAARDQENLAHGHQTVLRRSHSIRGQSLPKTPGNKASKTPFKLPLNDENAPPGFGGGKTGLKVNGRGNDNLIIEERRMLRWTETRLSLQWYSTQTTWMLNL